MKRKSRCALVACLMLTALSLSACGNVGNKKSFSTDAYTSCYIE